MFDFFEGHHITFEVVNVKFTQLIWIIIEWQACIHVSSVGVAIEVVLKTIGLLTCELYLKWNDKSIKWSELEFHREVKSRPVSYRNDVELSILLD